MNERAIPHIDSIKWNLSVRPYFLACFPLNLLLSHFHNWPESETQIDPLKGQIQPHQQQTSSRTTTNKQTSNEILFIPPFPCDMTECNGHLLGFTCPQCSVKEHPKCKEMAEGWSRSKAAGHGGAKECKSEEKVEWGDFHISISSRRHELAVS